MKLGYFRIEREEANLWKGLVAGMVAGFAATYIKDRFQNLLASVEKAEAKPLPAGQTKPRPEDPATVKAANAMSQRFLHRQLRKKEKDLAGPMVDYGFGSLAGMMYGAAAEVAPVTTIGGGAGFGSALWVVADELAVPATGLAKWPNKYPAKTHAYGFSGHLIYGMAMELVRRIVRSSLD